MLTLICVSLTDTNRWTEQGKKPFMNVMVWWEDFQGFEGKWPAEKGEVMEYLSFFYIYLGNNS